MTLIAWSDYLCPWCFNAAVRLHRIEEEFAPGLPAVEGGRPASRRRARAAARMRTGEPEIGTGPLLACPLQVEDLLGEATNEIDARGEVGHLEAMAVGAGGRDDLLLFASS